MESIRVFATSLLALSAVFAAGPMLAADPEPVLLGCKSEKGEDFTIELFSPSPAGPLHCVSGLLIPDMTPCAPDQGWGLSYPTGAANLASVTTLWAEADRHYGGKFTATLGPMEFSARSVFGEGLEPDTGPDSYDISLTLDRTTGKGSYESGALGRVSFSCEVLERKF